jgi:hypothetical protein
MNNKDVIKALEKCPKRSVWVVSGKALVDVSDQTMVIKSGLILPTNEVADLINKTNGVEFVINEEKDTLCRISSGIKILEATRVK